MKVAAVAILCQDPRVFASMEHAGTPCPYEGSIGKAAKAKWQKYGNLRPDYELYVKNLQIKEEADEEEQKQITKDLTKMDSERQIHDVQVKQNIEWKKPR